MNTTTENSIEATGCFAKPTPDNCRFFAHTLIRDDFTGDLQSCFFYEDMGRDVSFPRWRVAFYYRSHQALTKFFESEADKNAFLAALPNA